MLLSQLKNIKGELNMSGNKKTLAQKLMKITLSAFIALTASGFMPVMASQVQATVGSGSYLTNNGYTVTVPYIDLHGVVSYCLTFDDMFPTTDDYTSMGDPYLDKTMQGIGFYGYGGVNNSLQLKYGLDNNQARYGTGIAYWKRAKQLGIPGNTQQSGFNNLQGNQAIINYINELMTKTPPTDKNFSLQFNGNIALGNQQVTDPIGISEPSLAYTVQANNATVTDVNGNPKSSFGAGEKFRLKVAGSFIGKVTTTVTTKQVAYGNIVFKANVAGMQQLVQMKQHDPHNVKASLDINFKGSLEDIEITKTNNVGKTLPNAKFLVSKSPDFSNAVEVVSDSNGKIFLNDYLIVGEKAYIKEKSAPIISPEEGYYPTTNVVEVVANPNDNSQTNGVTIKNNEMDGKIELTKNDDSGNLMPNVEFTLFNKNMEEIAKKVTDEQGKIVFDDLKLGHYTIIETLPDGYKEVPPIEVDVVASGTGNEDPNFQTVEVKVGQENIELHPAIQTTATNEVGGKVMDVNEDAELTDTVAYTDLMINREHTISGIVMDKETEKPLLVDGQQVTAQTVFTPTEYKGQTVDVVFNFNTKGLAGKELVVFQEVRNEKGILVTEHKDIADEGQTVRVQNPEIGTTATNEVGGKVMDVNEEVELTDTIAYKDLTIGKEYTAHGIIMDKETGEPLLVDDKEVAANSTFIPKETSGTVGVVFNFNTKGLAGKELVVFETVTNPDGEIVVEHKDIADDGQTVRVQEPTIGTTATNEVGGKVMDVNEDVELTDTIEYEDLTIGKMYTAQGIVMDKATEKPLLVDGKEVTAQTVFTPQIDGNMQVGADIPTLLPLSSKGGTEQPAKVQSTIDGEVKVVFNFNTKGLVGKELVVFETVTNPDGEIVAEHKDINDEGQTVRVQEPTIGTTATNEVGGKVMDVNEDVELTDTIAYEDLTIGKMYTVHGIIMDKETEKPLLVDGQQVTAQTVFTPQIDGNMQVGADIPTLLPLSSKGGTEQPAKVQSTIDGEVKVVFNFNTKGLVGKELVVFETVTNPDGEIVAEHKDINDEGQTVQVQEPKIGTMAKDSDGDKNLALNQDVTVIDEVYFENLTVGKEYTAYGIIMDKETGEPLLVDGQQVIGEATFTPIETTGTVKVEFTFNTQDLKGKELVVFETVTNPDGEIVAEHKDINDKGQTVQIDLPPVAQLVKTGADLAGMMTIAGASIALVGAAVKRKKEGSDQKC